MKIFIILLISLASNALKAQEKAISDNNEQMQHYFYTGAITYHFFDLKEDSLKYKKNIGDQGRLISHPMVGYELLKHDKRHINFKSATIFKDSLGSISLGLHQGRGMKINTIYDIGYFYGFYLIRQNIWEKNKIEVPLRIKFGRNVGVTPFIGLRQGLTLPIHDKIFFKTTLAILPNIATLVIGVVKDFE